MAQPYLLGGCSNYIVREFSSGGGTVHVPVLKARNTLGCVDEDVSTRGLFHSTDSILT